MLRHFASRVLAGSQLALRWTTCLTTLNNGRPVSDDFLWNVSLMKNSIDNSDLPYSVIRSATATGGPVIAAKAIGLFIVTINVNSTGFAENCFQSISNTKL